MDRAELYMLDVYKRHELEKRLKPIMETEWSKIKKNDLIWHKDSNNIKGFDFFKEISNEYEDIIIYKNQDGEEYSRSKTGWYYYDECIAEDVENYWTPKLWCVQDENNLEDFWHIIACNEKHLLSCWNEENHDDLTYEEFTKEYYINEFTNCGDFEIVIR